MASKSKQKLTLAPHRYVTPRSEYIDQETLIARLEAAGKSIAINAKANPCCGHCWDPLDVNHPSVLECPRPCGACGSIDHNGNYCYRLYMSQRMWKRHYSLGFPPEFVQVKPTEADEALLEQEGYLARNGGKLEWTVELPELTPPTTAPSAPRPRQSPYTPSQRPSRLATPANQRPMPYSPGFGYSQQPVDRRGPPAFLGAHQNPMPYSQGSGYVQQPIHRQGPPASLDHHRGNRANDYGFTMPDRSGGSASTLRAPRATSHSHMQRHSPYARPSRPQAEDDANSLPAELDKHLETAVEVIQEAFEENGSLEEAIATMRDTMYQSDEYRSLHGLPLRTSQSIVPPPPPNTLSHAPRAGAATNVGSYGGSEMRGPHRQGSVDLQLVKKEEDSD